MTTQQNRPSRAIGPKPKGSHTMVNVRMLEDTLEAFKSEIGHSLSYWFTQAVHPILADFEARIAVIEWAVLPWYKKIWYRFTLKREELAKAKKEAEQPPEPETVPEQPPEPEETPETDCATIPEHLTGDIPPERPTRVCARCGQLFIIHDQSRICPICRLKDA